MRTNGTIFVLCGILGLASVTALPAQNQVDVKNLSGELASLHTVLSSETISGKERHDALVRLARIQLLSGDVEAAAASWEQAAYAESGVRDDMALLESAACAMAMGEWDKAESAARIVLLTARDDRKTFLKAKYLNAQIEAFRSGDTMILDTFLSDAEFAQERAAIYYTLWKTSGIDEYKSRLLIEYPESPETKSLLIEAGAVSNVRVFPGAMWLLPGTKAPGTYAAREVLTAPLGSLETASPPAVQTGLFSAQNSALAQQGRLIAQGFQANVSLRQAAGGEYWAVSVPAGPDVNTMVIKLKEAGYDALPMF
jgi:tetratricopeptide (TPR) repeat protein